MTSTTLNERDIIDTIIKFKDNGNKFVKAEQYDDAIDEYDKAVQKLQFVTHEGQCAGLNAVLYLNLAYCNLKLQRYVTCISFCDDVLKLTDDKNIREKCLYRRGEANRCLMHIDRALQDFRAVLEITSTNRDALDGIARCKTIQIIPFENGTAEYAEVSAHGLLSTLCCYNRLEYITSNVPPDLMFPFVSEGLSLLMEMVFDDDLKSGTLINVLEATNFGAFSRTEKMLLEHNIIYDENITNQLCNEMVLTEVLFHAIILRRVLKYRKALEILESKKEQFSTSSTIPQRLLFLLEKCFCLKLIRLEESTNGKDSTIHSICIIDLLREATKICQTELNTFKELVFDIQTLIIEEYIQQKQRSMVYEELSRLVYIGNPIFQTHFWLQIAKDQLSEKRMLEFIACLAVAGYAVLNDDNVLQICDYYLLSAKAHLYEGDYDGFVGCREKGDKLLTETLFKNDYSSTAAFVFQYKTMIAAWYDEYEALCIDFSRRSRKKNCNLQAEKLEREAFRTADWRISRGYVTEEMILAHCFELQSNTVKIPENCAYLTYKINGFYNKGKIDCLILAAEFHDLVRTGLDMDEEKLLERLAPILNDVNKEHTFEQNIDQIKSKYPALYKDFLSPIEAFLNEHKIFNVKIVSSDDFYRKVLGMQTKQLSEKDLLIPPEHCYIQYSSCTLKTNGTIYCYVIFGRQNIKFEIIDLKEHNLRVDQFLDNITFMAEGFNERQDDKSIDESDIDVEKWTRLRKEFFKILFKPIMIHLKQIKCIQIIAEEELLYIPFSSLLVSEDDEKYLIDLFEISFVLSAGFDQIYQLNSFNKESNVSCQLEVFTTETVHPEFEEEYDLDYSLVEIIEKLQHEQIPFTPHSSATKEEVEIFLKSRIHSKPSIFHYAGHTFYDEQQVQSNYALSGCMILQYDNGKERLETMLYSNQIANYDLRTTRLAVLNSCSTLKGSSLTRSGHLGLARGFIIAGVSTVVATTIDLETNISVEFAKRFYKYLQEGLTISCSFTRTIRDLKELNDYRSPDYWGPFVLFGCGFNKLNICT
ncbi:unnamed protein product [Adineta ricciae]|uniref:CHAT domain-containing protein n=3 Tax=Adineta ricciae TaxID=249248 RepID=A0A815KJT3_ADIRI|nr:unnamed protein product [Adineta ricciae]